MFAYHFDLKRGLWNLDYMERAAARLREWGYDTIVIELEDKLRFKNHKGIWAPDALSPAAMASFSRRCRARGLDVIPLVQTLGHAEYVLKHPEYAHLRENPAVNSQYDPLSKDAQKLVIELCDQAIDAVNPAEFFHAGGDETWDLGKFGRAKDAAARIGIGRLYLNHMLPILRHIHKRGLRPMIWADMCLTHPEIIREIPGYVVMVDWDYWTSSERPWGIMLWGGLKPGESNRSVSWRDIKDKQPALFKKHFKKYAVDAQTRRDGSFRPFYCSDALLGMGCKNVLTAPADSCYGDMCGVPRNTIHWPNCFYAARKGLNDCMGAFVTSWAVRHAHHEVKLPGAFAAALGASTSGRFDAQAFSLTFTHRFYGKPMPEFEEAARLAETPLHCGQSFWMEQHRPEIERGIDPLVAFAESFASANGGRAKAAARLDEIISGFKRSAAMFKKMKRSAPRNAGNLDYWIEGVELNRFYADCAAAAMRGMRKRAAAGLFDRMKALRAGSKKLFASTHTRQGVKTELDARYGFHNEYLTKGKQ